MKFILTTHNVTLTKAIEDRTGFTLDAEIISFKGIRRWIRITATVESVDGVAVRIFGMKQDITDEKILADRTRYLACSGIDENVRRMIVAMKRTACDAGEKRTMRDEGMANALDHGHIDNAFRYQELDRLRHAFKYRFLPGIKDALQHSFLDHLLRERTEA